MLDCFAYAEETVVSPRIWRLFTQLGKSMRSYESGGMRIEHAQEILEAALAHRINLDDAFNLQGYEFRIQSNEKRQELSAIARHPVVGLSNVSDEDNGEGWDGTVSVDFATAHQSVEDIKDDYDALMDTDELAYAVSQIKAINARVAVTDNIDIIYSLRQAVGTDESGTHSPQAVAALRKFCTANPTAAEYIKIILSSGVPIEEVFSA